VSARSVADLELAGRRVFLRADLNVPLRDGRVADDTRLRASLATLDLVRRRGGRVLLASHLGRPKKGPSAEFSLRPVAEALGLPLAPDCIGPEVEALAAKLRDGDALVLENLRFHPGEEKNDPDFAKALAELADAYVNDAFGAAHRAHASTAGITRYVGDVAAGDLLQSELEHLRVVREPVRPLVVALGGAKVSDKLEVIENLIPRVDALLVGGAMAYTFFKARGVPVGRSLVEEDLLDSARDIERRAKERSLRFELPVDHVVAPKLEAGAPAETLAVGDPAIGDRMGLDIGPKTAQVYRQAIADARTVVWNGPMGVFEIDAFANGTIQVARAVAAVKGTTVIGGGDSIAAVAKAGVTDRITHISTGGGASLEFLAGRTLPGVAALPDK
jgi:phosphoglycerate kinase